MQAGSHNFQNGGHTLGGGVWDVGELQHLSWVLTMWENSLNKQALLSLRYNYLLLFIFTQNFQTFLWLFHQNPTILAKLWAFSLIMFIPNMKIVWRRQLRIAAYTLCVVQAWVLGGVFFITWGILMKIDCLGQWFITNNAQQRAI